MLICAVLVKPNLAELLGHLVWPVPPPDSGNAVLSILGGIGGFVGAPGADPTETDAGLVRAFSPSGALRQAIAPAAGTYCAGAGSRLAAGPGFLAVGIVDCFGEAAVLGFSR